MTAKRRVIGKKERAAFWARLASVDSLDELSPVEVEDLSPHLTFAGEPYGVPSGAQLVIAHDVARSVLLPIIQGKDVQLNVDRRVKWSLDADGSLVEVVERGTTTTQAHAALADVLRSGRRVFGICPRCGAVFARSRHQLRCSANCTQRALSESRRADKAEYMRRYRRQNKQRKDKS